MADLRRTLGLVLAAVAACGDDGSGDETTVATMTGGATDAATGGPAATTGDTTAPTGGDATGEAPSGTTAEGPTSGAATTEVDMTTGSVEMPDGSFIAVGDGGRRARSIDGETWEMVIGSGLLDTDEEAAAPDGLRALAVGDGYVVAVGGGGTHWTSNSRIMRSTDAGATWTDDVLAGVDNFPHSKLYGVAASGQTVVAVGVRGRRIRSVDGGQTWADVSFEDQNARLLGVAALGATFVVVGWTEDSYEAPKTSAILASADDGATWGPVDESFARLDAIAAGSGVFIAIGAGLCLRSSDGVAWVDCGVLTSEFQSVTHIGDEFVLVTLEGLATSPDGVTWSTPELPVYGAPKALARGNGRYAGVRWTDRGWAEDLTGWTYSSHATEPLRAIVFVPTP